MTPWVPISIALVLNGAAGLVGGLFSDRWIARRGRVLVGFAAGGLLGAVFFDTLPEAIDSLGSGATVWAFAGFALAGAWEWLVGRHEHGPPRVKRRAAPVVLLTSDALHNVADGAAVAAAFLVSERAGLVAAFAVISHEVPQELGDYALLRHWGYPRGRALFALALVQLTAFAGAFSLAAATAGSQQLSATALAIGSGAFLYIGAVDLVPDLRAAAPAAGKSQQLVGFGAGVAVVATIRLFAS